MDIVARVKNILMTPKTEWPVIAAEPTDIAQLYTGYIVILAAIPPLASLIGLTILGLPLGLVITSAVLRYVFSLIGVLLFGFIAAKLAPMFGGRDDLVQGVKLTAFTNTAVWIGGIFLIIPRLGSLISLLCGLYALYLLYLGISVVMTVPESRAVGYLLSLIAVAIVIVIVLVVIGGVVGLGMM